jgi:flagellar export protein FliJ
VAFRFPLAPVLKLRESLEEHELQLLEQAQHEIARTLHLLEEMKNRRRIAVTAKERELASGMVAAHLQFSEHIQHHLLGQEQALVKSLAELQLRRKHQMEIYEEAKRKRQMLSELREKHQAAYEGKLAHHSQRIADDSFLARLRRG